MRRRCVRMSAGGLAAMCGMAASAWGGPIVSTWTAMNGVWGDANNWDTPDFPNNVGGMTYRAVIDRNQADYTVTLDLAITVTDLDLREAALGAPTLDVTSFDLLVENDFLHEGGTLFGGAGAGTVEVGGALTLRNSVTEAVAQVMNTGSLVFDSTICDDICDTPIIAAGASAAWMGSGDIRLLQGGSLTIESPTTFTIMSAQTLMGEAGGAAEAFINNGTLVREVGQAGATTLTGIDFTNDGSLRVDGGTLSIDGTFTNIAAGVLAGGAWEVNGGSTLDLVGQAVTTNQADVTLRDAGSSFAAVDGLSVNDAAGSFTVENGRDFTTAGAFTNDGMLRVGDSTTFEVNGALTNQAGTTLTGGMYEVGGTLRYDGADVRTVDAGVVLDGAGAAIVDESDMNALRMLGAVASSGSVDLLNGQSLMIEAGAGDLTVQTGGALRVDASTLDSQGGTLVVEAGSTAVVENNSMATLGAGGLLVEDGGAATVDTGSMLMAQGGDVSVGETGMLTVGTGSVVEIAEGFTLTNLREDGRLVDGEFDLRGVIRVDNAEVRRIRNTVVLDGEGSGIENLDGMDAFNFLEQIDETGRLTLRNGRTLDLQGPLTVLGDLIIEAPGGGALTAGAGMGAGALTIAGDLTLGERSRVQMTIGGTTAGEDYLPIDVVGTLVLVDETGDGLAGVLKLRITDEFDGTLGESFDVMLWGDRDGAFERIIGLYVGPGLRLAPTYTAEGLRMTVVEVPAPGGAVMLGLAALAGLRRRR